MPYTSAQQAKLDTAKAKLDSAKIAFDNAYSVSKTYHDVLFRCVGGKGTTNNCPSGQPLGSDSFPAFGSPANSGACKICNALKDCKSDCCNEASCVTKVGEYNGSLSAYNTTRNNYSTAQTNYNVVLDEVATELENDPTLQGNIAGAIQDAKGDTTIKVIQWIIFGTLALLLVGGFVYFKWIKPRMAKA